MIWASEGLFLRSQSFIFLKLGEVERKIQLDKKE